MTVQNKKFITLLITSTLALTIFSVIGCKKKTEPAAPEVKKEVISEVIEQKICPVMGGAINKELYTEYKGKKVYFCCPGCENTFTKEPDKYVSKLPQFSN